MIGGCKSEGGKDHISQSLMVLHSYEETLQEDTLHFIISHKWKEKKPPHFLLIYYQSEHTAITLTLSNYFCCYSEIMFMGQVNIQDLPTLEYAATCPCSNSDGGT